MGTRMNASRKSPHAWNTHIPHLPKGKPSQAHLDGHPHEHLEEVAGRQARAHAVATSGAQGCGGRVSVGGRRGGRGAPDAHARGRCIGWWLVGQARRGAGWCRARAAQLLHCVQAAALTGRRGREMKEVRVTTPASANSLATSPMRRMFSSRSVAAGQERQNHGVHDPGAGSLVADAPQPVQQQQRPTHSPCTPPRELHLKPSPPVKPRLAFRPCRMLSPSSSTVRRPRCASACSSVQATVDLPLPLRPARSGGGPIGESG